MVLAKECFYALLLIVGVATCPHFLLFSPLSDADRSFRAGYLLSPDAFVADTIAMKQQGSPLGRLAQGTAMLTSVLSLASSIALCIGFWRGAMTPTLACGYILSGLTPLGLFWTSVFPRQRSGDGYSAMKIPSAMPNDEPEPASLEPKPEPELELEVFEDQMNARRSSEYSSVFARDDHTAFGISTARST